MRKAILVIVAFRLTVGAPIGGSAAEAADVTEQAVIEQIEAGKAYYAEGDLSRALTEFEYAVNAVRTEFSNLFMATLPDAPAFWSAEKPSPEGATALFGGGVMVTRNYREQKGEGRITAELMVDNPMVQALSTVIGNPMMIAANPTMKRLRFGKAVALLNWDDIERSGDLSLSLGGRVLVKLVGRNLEDETALVALMKAWDLEAVRDVAGL